MPNRPCKASELNHVGFEGAYLLKANGRYYLSCAERYYERYHCMTAESRTLLGPTSHATYRCPTRAMTSFFRT
ncbi:hypothetical protein E5K00_11640 [Hymenobacter aquaticus]|uniref:Uncharacterized protein n=1 Tax=Hymenobacter aquaticus TaxID=1867101 RepID=A0A4Z0Q8X9_9BACT|nr:hypothetical protein E5K00_11640 [Hymenobacter aquaticus]